MMTSTTCWWRKTKSSFTTVWIFLVVFSLCLSCLANTTPKQNGGQAEAEVNVGQGNNGTDNGTSSSDDSCYPVDHGEGRGGMKCLGCHYSADPAPKSCNDKKIYECYKGEVCVTRLQQTDSGKGNIEKGCTSMYKNKEFKKWINIRNTVLGDIRTKEMLCNDTDCCNESEEIDAVGSFKASLLITVIMIMFTKLTKSMITH